MPSSATLVGYDEALSRYDPLIGLETHVELGTRTKLFCGCPATFGGEPNTHVCPVCLGLPGSLPVPSQAAIEYTIRIGLALNCSIAEWCRFARKNYFYPDMPKNFQISQYDEPLCTDGWLDVTLDEAGPDGGPRTFRVGIERVHLEEDTGKSQHMGGATGRIHGADYSLVDYNRAGIPLVEIVTRPVEDTGALAPAVAHAYVAELRDLLRSLGVSDVRMEEGSLRCDVNTSLSPRGSGRWGTRTETKNVDSLRSVERQCTTRSGARPRSSTPASGRYRRPGTSTRTPGSPRRGGARRRHRTTGFPEPDLVPLAPPRDWVEQIRPRCPNCPRPGRPGCRGPGHRRGEMTNIRNAGRSTWSSRRSPRPSPRTRQGWLNELARRANDTRRTVQPADHPGRRRGRCGTVGSRASTTGWPASHRRRAGHEGTPAEVVAAAPWPWSATTGARRRGGQAIRRRPDVAEKIRGGKVAAAGASSPRS